ncbi:MAG: UrcA family protein [Pseudomonadota bacterium]
MLTSIRVAALCATLSLAAAPALAQSNFQCVGGELLGGPQGFACETDAEGNIINVQPSAMVETAPTPRPAPVPRAQTRTTTIYRSGTPSTVHTPQTRQTYRSTHRPQTRYTTRATTTTTTSAPVTRTYRSSQAPTTRTTSTYTTRSTYTHAPQPRYARPPARTVYYAPAPQRIAPTPRRCEPILLRLKDTRDGRRQFEVCYADLTPLGFSGADALYDRIQTAAKRACRGHSSFSLIRTDRRCRRDAVRQAVIDVNTRDLDVVYADRTGRSIPRVRVGRPIYR